MIAAWASARNSARRSAGQVDLGGDAERGLGGVEVAEVGLKLLGQAEQVLVAAGAAARAGAAEASDEPAESQYEPRRRLVDALDDRAHPPLGDSLDEARLLEHLHVVVDALGRQAERRRNLRAGPGLGKLAEHIEAGGLEERRGLVEPVEEERVPHCSISIEHSTTFEHSRQGGRARAAGVTARRSPDAPGR